jgi:hypothetical protein
VKPQRSMRRAVRQGRILGKSAVVRMSISPIVNTRFSSNMRRGGHGATECGRGLTDLQEQVGTVVSAVQGSAQGVARFTEGLELWRAAQVILCSCWIIGNRSNSIAARFHPNSLSVIAKVDQTVQLLIRHPIILCHVDAKS